MGEIRRSETAPEDHKDDEINRLKTTLEAYSFISSHDLQEPLRNMQMLTSILLEKEGNNLSEDGKIYLKKLSDSAKKIRTLINDLVEYTNTTKSVPERADLNKIVTEAKKNLLPIIKESHTKIEYEELPTINVVRFQFVKIFIELISNSIRFARPGVNPVIKIRARKLPAEENAKMQMDPKERYIEISVEDNGLGFDKKFNNKVFQIFQKLHGKGKSGSGIGLPTCKKIVENHGGSISAGSETGVGTTIKLYIPDT